MSQIWDIKNRRPAVFHPRALEEIQEYPPEARQKLGKAIFKLQMGEKLAMPLSRPMKTIGKGVEELRIRDETGIYRIFYFCRHEEAVFVFHAFQKKTQETPEHEIALAKKRLKELLDEKN